MAPRGIIFTCVLLILNVIIREPCLAKLECSKKTLTLLHVIFRHGNKTLEGDYPNDPYKNETYQPYGKGQLTNAGKLLGYRTGQYLRKTYSKFLGSYSPGVLEAYASPSWRCKAYLQLIMTSLYPIDKSSRWHENVHWDPIPFNSNCTLATQMFWTYAVCPNFKKVYEGYKRTKQYQKTMEPYKAARDYLIKSSGLSPNESYIYGPIIFLHAALTSQVEWGLDIPSWMEGFWPEIIDKIAAMEWSQVYASEVARKLGSGFIMSKIIKDTYSKINRDASAVGRKIYLYVGHDTNIYSILASLGVLKPTIMNFGSYIIFEVHNVHGDNYIKVLLQNSDVSTAPVTLNIPKCGYCCPFGKFVDLYSDYLKPEEVCN